MAVAAGRSSTSSRRTRSCRYSASVGGKSRATRPAFLSQPVTGFKDLALDKRSLGCPEESVVSKVTG